MINQLGSSEEWSWIREKRFKECLLQKFNQKEDFAFKNLPLAAFTIVAARDNTSKAVSIGVFLLQTTNAQEKPI